MDSITDLSQSGLPGWKVWDTYRNERPARILLDRNNRLQSGVLFSEAGPVPLFSYAILMRSMIIRAAPERLLMIGSGGCSVTSSLDDLPRRLELTVVDSNPAMCRVAKDFFSPPLHTKFWTADASEFLLGCRDSFDMILIDAFGPDGLCPAELIRLDIANALRRILLKNGTFMWNISLRNKRDWFCALADMALTLESSSLCGEFMISGSTRQASNALFCSPVWSSPPAPGWQKIKSRPAFYRPRVCSVVEPFSWPDSQL